MYAIYGNMDPINLPPMLVYIPYMDPMGYGMTYGLWIITDPIRGMHIALPGSDRGSCQEL